MKSSLLSKIAFTLLLIASLSSCANLSKTDRVRSKTGVEYSTDQKTHQLTDISQLNDREKADLYEAIIAADLAAANGEYELATSYYLAAASLSKSIELIQLSVDAAEQSGDNLAMLQAADIWLEIAPKDLEALTLKIAALLFHQQISQALEYTAQLFELQQQPAKRFELLESIAQNQQPGVINTYLDQLVLKDPAAIAVFTSKASFLIRIAKHTRNPAATMKQAFFNLQKAFDLKQDFMPAIDLNTRLLYQAHQDEKAEAFLRQLNANFPESKPISQLLGQLLYDLRKYDLTKQHYLSWLKKHQDDTEARFYLAASYFATSNYKRSLYHYRQILGSDYKPQLVYFFCGNSAGKLKQYSQATACYELVQDGKYLTRSKIELAKLYALTGEIDKALATVRNPKFAVDENTQIQLINIEVELLAQYVNKDQAKQRLTAAMENFPQNVSLLFKKIKIEELSSKPKELVTILSKAEQQIPEGAKKQQFNLSVAGFLRNKNHYQQAVDWLDNALKQLPDDRDYLYARALYKEPLGLYDEMIADFKYLLNLDPDNLNIKNALGYTLVDLNQEIDYASELIEQAYLAMPDNAAVIDSKGWLAYRRGLYPQAIKYLIKSFRISPSADVATHIGEVYWKSGDKQKALEFWQQAKEMEPENFLLLSTIKKLDVELGKE